VELSDSVLVKTFHLELKRKLCNNVHANIRSYTERWRDIPFLKCVQRSPMFFFFSNVIKMGPVLLYSERMTQQNNKILLFNYLELHETYWNENVNRTRNVCLIFRNNVCLQHVSSRCIFRVPVPLEVLTRTHVGHCVKCPLLSVRSN
jgi:hypothetical protein